MSSLFRKQSLRVLLIALLLSLLGHLILFFGLPFISFSTVPDVSDDLIIRSELKLEPPKKIQMTRAPKPKPKEQSSSNDLFNDRVSNLSTQGGAFNQVGVPFKLPESGTIYYDSFVDGQKLQTGEIHWIVDGNSYRLYVNIPMHLLGLLSLNQEERLILLVLPQLFIGPNVALGRRVTPALIEIQMEEGRCSFRRSLNLRPI